MTKILDEEKRSQWTKLGVGNPGWFGGRILLSLSFACGACGAPSSSSLSQYSSPPVSGSDDQNDTITRSPSPVASPNLAPKGVLDGRWLVTFGIDGKCSQAQLPTQIGIFSVQADAGFCTHQGYLGSAMYNCPPHQGFTSYAGPYCENSYASCANPTYQQLQASGNLGAPCGYLSSPARSDGWVIDSNFWFNDPNSAEQYWSSQATVVTSSFGLQPNTKIGITLLSSYGSNVWAINYPVGQGGFLVKVGDANYFSGFMVQQPSTSQPSNNYSCYSNYPGAAYGSEVRSGTIMRFDAGGGGLCQYVIPVTGSRL